MRPSQALCPGLSVSETEPSGDNLSRFSKSSSRSLGHSLLLGQRSRMNFFSHHIRSFLFEDRIDSSGELSGHRHNGFSRRPVARVTLENRAVTLSKLNVLTDGRPGRLDQLTSQSSISGARDLTARNPLSGGVFAWSQANKARQLSNVAELLRIADSGQKMAGHDPADPRYRH